MFRYYFQILIFSLFAISLPGVGASPLSTTSSTSTTSASQSTSTISVTTIAEEFETASLQFCSDIGSSISTETIEHALSSFQQSIPSYTTAESVRSPFLQFSASVASATTYDLFLAASITFSSSLGSSWSSSEVEWQVYSLEQSISNSTTTTTLLAALQTYSVALAKIAYSIPTTSGTSSSSIYSSIASSSVASSTSTSSAAATSVSSGLTILNFNYGSSDQTSTAISNLVTDSGISIDTDNMVPPFTDAWTSQSAKSIVMLFEDGTDKRIFVTSSNSGNYSVVSGDVTLSANTSELYGYPTPSGSSITILAIVWGKAEVRSDTAYKRLYHAASTGSSFPWLDEFFGIDTWWGTVKSGVVYYLDSNGNLQSIYGHEHTRARFSTSS